MPGTQEFEPRRAAGAPAAIAPRPLVPREQDDVFLHIDLWRSLFLHRKLAVAIAAAGVIAAVLYIVLTGPVYKAQSQIYVQPSPPRLMDLVADVCVTERLPARGKLPGKISDG